MRVAHALQCIPSSHNSDVAIGWSPMAPAESSLGTVSIRNQNGRPAAARRQSAGRSRWGTWCRRWRSRTQEVTVARPDSRSTITSCSQDLRAKALLDEQHAGPALDALDRQRNRGRATTCPYPLPLDETGATWLHRHRLIPGRRQHPFPQRLVMVAPSGERTYQRPPLLFMPCPVASPGAESMTHK